MNDINERVCIFGQNKCKLLCEFPIDDIRPQSIYLYVEFRLQLSAM